MFSRALKMKSGSSSSSENTPLLNGSHEGPCYAYSYANSRDDEEEEDEKTNDSSDTDSTTHSFQSILKHVNISFFVLIVVFCVICFIFIASKNPEWQTVAVTKGESAHVNLTVDELKDDRVIRLRVKGPFTAVKDGSSTIVTFSLSKITTNNRHEKISEVWIVLLSSDKTKEQTTLEHDFLLSEQKASSMETYLLSIATNKKQDYVSLLVELTAANKLSTTKIICALCLLILLHVIIIFELLPRVLGSMLAAVVAISILALVSQCPSLEDMVSWINIEMLCLTFGLNIITSILCETGFFEFIAVLIYKLTEGNPWSIFSALFFTTAILSICLGSLTTVILMSALAIRLGEAMNIDSKHILIALIMFTNIGSVIGQSTFSLKAPETIAYSQYALHLFPVMLVSLVIVFIVWWLMFRNIIVLRFKEPLEVIEVKHEREVWQRTYYSLSNYSREEESVKAILKRKISVLETLLMKKLYDSKIATDDDYKSSLKELTHTLKVKKRSLLYKSSTITFTVLIFLLLQNVTQFNINSGWITLLGAICLLILGDFDKTDSVLNRAEWPPLLLLVSLSIFSKILIKLDLVEYLATTTIHFLNDVNENMRLLISIIVLLWISALSSTLFIPFSTVMLQMVSDGGGHLNPLTFALSLGTSLGGNGSLLGCFSNILGAGIAEQHGYPFSYFQFFKIGFPVMLITTTISMVYLLICHVWLDWNS